MRIDSPPINRSTINVKLRSIMSPTGARRGDDVAKCLVSTRRNQKASTLNLIKLILIAIFIEYQLFSQQPVLGGRSKGLIYNKDGKFIYRPPRVNQGHIIVIDDRHHSKESSSSSSKDSGSKSDSKSQNDNHPQQQQQQIAASSDSVYHQFQLLGPRLYHPDAARLGGFYPATAAAGLGQPVQLINLHELQTIAHPSAMLATRAAGALLQPHAPALQAAASVHVVPLIQMYHHHPAAAAASSAAVRAQRFTHIPAPYGHSTEAAFALAEGSPPPLPAASGHAHLHHSHHYGTQHLHQPTHQHTVTLEGGHYGPSSSESSHFPSPSSMMAASRAYAEAAEQQQQQHQPAQVQMGAYEPQPYASFNSQHAMAPGPSEGYLEDSMMPPPSRAHGAASELEVGPPPQAQQQQPHRYIGGGSSRGPRSRSLATMIDMSGNPDQHEEGANSESRMSAANEGQRDEQPRMAAFPGPSFKTNPPPINMMRGLIDSSMPGLIMPQPNQQQQQQQQQQQLQPRGHHQRTKMSASSNADELASIDRTRLSNHQKRNSHSQLRPKLPPPPPPLMDEGGFPRAGPNSGDNYHPHQAHPMPTNLMGHDEVSASTGGDESHISDQKGNEYWKQYKDQFELTH